MLFLILHTGSLYFWMKQLFKLIELDQREYTWTKRFYKKGDATQCKAEVEHWMKQERWYHRYLYHKGTSLYSPHKGVLWVWIPQSPSSFRDKLHPLLVKSVTSHLQNCCLLCGIVCHYIPHSTFQDRVWLRLQSGNCAGQSYCKAICTSTWDKKSPWGIIPCKQIILFCSRTSPHQSPPRQDTGRQ